MTSTEIINKLPYVYPFLYVDEILSVDNDAIVGTYRYPNDLPFYQGHFKNNPVTPGVILTETMAQIGLVSLGIYITRDQDLAHNDINNEIEIAMTNATIDYFLPVLPTEEVTVKAYKVYFRFNKLKCKVEMYNKRNQLVSRGHISGMIKL